MRVLPQFCCKNVTGFAAKDAASFTAIFLQWSLPWSLQHLLWQHLWQFWNKKWDKDTRDQQEWVTKILLLYCHWFLSKVILQVSPQTSRQCRIALKAQAPVCNLRIIYRFVCLSVSKNVCPCLSVYLSVRLYIKYSIRETFASFKDLEILAKASM